MLKTCDTRAENISSSLPFLHSKIFLHSTLSIPLLSPKLNLKTSTITNMEWTKKQYNQQYENYMPWIEDNVLYYFTKDNKASYATKGMFCPRTTHQTTILTPFHRPAQQDQDHRQRTSRQRPRWREQPCRRSSRTRRTSTTRGRPRLQRRHQPRRERR